MWGHMMGMPALGGIGYGGIWVIVVLAVLFFMVRRR